MGGCARSTGWPGGLRLTTDDLPPLYELRAALQAQLEAGRAEGHRTQPDLARQLEKLRWGVTIEDGRLALTPRARAGARWPAPCWATSWSPKSTGCGPASRHAAIPVLGGL